MNSPLPDRTIDAPYRGRFAPSPTGPLHFGSLVAAVGSYLDARRNSGTWLIRIEDLDRQREVPGAADGILRTLETFGFAWDGPVIHQSARTQAYREATDRLSELELTYACSCSRGEIARVAKPGIEGWVYPGTCRRRPAAEHKPKSLRLHAREQTIEFTDRVQGLCRQQLEREIGDFVIHRADGIFAYQLAVVVDDAWQGITEVVRGADLLLSTPRQLYLQQLLGLPRPGYAHLPLAVDRAGRKLSKSCAAAPVDPQAPLPSLLHALEFLGQPLPPQRPANLEEFWAWATTNWQLEVVPDTTKRKPPSEWGRQ